MTAAIQLVPTQHLNVASGGLVPLVLVSNTAVIKKAIFTNFDTVDRLFSLYISTISGVHDTSNVVISNHRLSPGETYDAYELSGLVLVTGNRIYAWADAAAKVNVTISGITF